MAPIHGSRGALRHHADLQAQRVRETAKPIAQVTRDLGISEGPPPSASTTTRSWPTVRWRWRWRWRCVAARSPVSSCIPTRAASTPHGLPPAGHTPVDGLAGIRPGHRGHPSPDTRALSSSCGVVDRCRWGYQPPAYGGDLVPSSAAVVGLRDDGGWPNFRIDGS